MARLFMTACIILSIAACGRAQDKCVQITPGMTISQVIEIMGEPRDSYLTGHPPDGIMLIYGYGRRSEWPHQPGGPIGIALDDAPSRAVSDRTVNRTYCNAL